MTVQNFHKLVFPIIIFFGMIFSYLKEVYRNKGREVSVSIAGKRKKLFYRLAPCNGVKICPHQGCNYVAQMSAQRSCKQHNFSKTNKTKDKSCPVQFAYILVS